MCDEDLFSGVRGCSIAALLLINKSFYSVLSLLSRPGLAGKLIEKVGVF